MAEPHLALDDIQGNVLPGFTLEHQALLVLRVLDPARFCARLRAYLPRVATAEQLFALRSALPADPRAAWINVGFSFEALRLLVGVQPSDLQDQAFSDGLAARAQLLGDPVDPSSPGVQQGWRFGGDPSSPEVALIAYSPARAGLSEFVAELQVALVGPAGGSSPASLTWLEHGGKAAEEATEHFGFRDGVSQPRLRGYIGATQQLLTPRRQSSAVPGSRHSIVWPGEFVFGYPEQSAEDAERPGPSSLATGAPTWLRNGSFLVMRRLEQRVALFHRFLRDEAARRGMSPERMGASIVGRWRSGAPAVASPTIDDPALGANQERNNAFGYYTATSGSAADIDGVSCPISAHVRKMNPRDVRARDGHTFPNPADSLRHRILRRGIPFGPPSTSTPAQLADDGIERGLLFMCYQTSIERQFEFLVRRWANEPNFPERACGVDPLIGQSNRWPDRRRWFRHGPGFADATHTTLEWVAATGGGYYFCPGLEGLSEILSMSNPV